MTGTVEEPRQLSPADRADLERAVRLLEDVSLVAKIGDLIGEPIEKAFGRLPEGMSSRVTEITNVALRRAIRMAILGMKDRPARPASSGLFKAVVAATGGVGGFFGLAALTVELPLSTTVMLRSIADIARSEGEDVEDLDTQLACIEVFALGGDAAADDAAETGYFAVRASLARMAPQIAKALSGQLGKGASRALAAVSARFSTVVAEKMAAQGVPIVGALGGATINVLFMDHFQDVATGHFTVRRLERTYGEALVRREYDRLSAAFRPPARA